MKNRESVFVNELKYNYAEQIRREAFTCPLCGGALIKKKGKYGEFWGCVNFSKTNCNFTRKANNWYFIITQWVNAYNALHAKIIIFHGSYDTIPNGYLIIDLSSTFK